MMTDPIADMLTRIRNGGKAQRKRVDMPVSKQRVEIARLLKENHLIHDYKVLDDGRHGVLRLYLKYYEERPVIRGLRRVSRPGRRQYAGVKDLPSVRRGMGMTIVSTSRGMMTGAEARSQNVGGEVVALIW